MKLNSSRRPRVQVSQEFTGDTIALEAAIRRTTVGGLTSLYNALSAALRELNELNRRDDGLAPRRRVIIVLSDGADTSSSVTYDSVLETALRSNTVIYAIGLEGEQLAAANQNGESGELVLRRFAEQTGGRAFFTDDVKDVADIYNRIRDELANQYLLAYESTAPRDGRWRRLQVRVTRPHTTVRSRAGYFAPAP
jgi:Ca-activated chloride channel homolog